MFWKIGPEVEEDLKGREGEFSNASQLYMIFTFLPLVGGSPHFVGSSASKLLSTCIEIVLFVA